MIRMIQSQSVGRAKAYFDDALAKSDYYAGDQELPGRFLGHVSERLGLKDAQATREVFHQLCENVNPLTGSSLTPRTIGQRTVGYDLNFHVPKSVSILNFLAKDDHILKAFQRASYATMLDVQADSKTRIRKGGQYDDRETGELLWAEFIHQTARPVDGSMSDPHLHSHNFIFNVTWDKNEGQFKAGQFRDIKRDCPYYEARFHKRLSDELTYLGYRIRKTEKFFEVEGVPQEVIDLFSKRTNEIGRIAQEKGITGVEERAALGARTRAKKQKGHTMAELKREWIRQIKSIGLSEEQSNPVIRHAKDQQREHISPQQCVDHALRHRFERVSVMQDRRVLEAAYRHALGKSVSLNSITDAFKSDRSILHIREKWRTVCTTKEVLAEEKNMVRLANLGKGKLKPLLANPEINLEGQQRDAVHHVLTTSNRVSIIKGRAGTGKTKLLNELRRLVTTCGKKVIAVAPTSQAAREVLRNDGFKNAETVAKLLVDKEMQKNLEGQMLMVDEAGLLSTKDMTSLLDLANKKNARLVLVGDTRQHSSVARGDALRILNTVGGIRSAQVSKIYRQKPKDYLEVVQFLSEGKVKEAFTKLDTMEAIKTVDPLKSNQQLVEDYVSAIQRRKSALVISPTHKQGEEVTQAIRRRLREKRLLGKKEYKFRRFSNLNFTEAQKADTRNYKQGHVIQFNQNVSKEVKRGSIWFVQDATDKELCIRNDDGKKAKIPINYANRFDVFQQSDILISKGDRIRITRNGFDAKDRRLQNGQITKVMAVYKSGQIKIRNVASKEEYMLPREYAHIAHAHCITSHASQGKTVDEVFISQPAATFPATDMKQFYVSVSRGKHRVNIYTDDKDTLLDYASESGDRQSAMELVGTDRNKDVTDRIRRDSTRHKANSRANSKVNTKSSYSEPEPEI